MNTRIRLSFQAKVLIPVIAVMIGLIALTLQMVNQRITASLERDATHKVLMAEAVFQNSQSIRTKNLILRYRNIPNEPRFKAVVQLPDANTVRFLLAELVEELGAATVAYVPANRIGMVAATDVVSVDTDQLATALDAQIGRTLEGQSGSDIVHVGNRLLDAVSVPVIIGERVAGALVVASELGEGAAKELAQLTDCQVVLLAENTPVVSTIKWSDAGKEITEWLALNNQSTVRTALIGGSHSLGIRGHFSSQPSSSGIGYLLLSSYDDALADLRATQRLLLLAGIVGVLAATTVVWFLVRSVTRPLRQLRDSAEAVGRGDFSQRVNVTSHDECGDLASVFNRMTTNVQLSQQELEKTVHTLKHTQEQLVQREKLSAIGEFVAGVTHELNNPLTSVLGYAELLQLSPLDDTQRRDTEAIVVGAQRCQKIVQNLLSFARQHKPEKKHANVNDLIENVLEFMQYDLRTSNIVIQKRFDASLPMALVDSHQLQQVFVNLIHNARQAIEAFRGDGQITISTVKQDGWLRLTFQDNGPGIPNENTQKVFDPFFTTKPVGKGTGLGLSLSYGIIKEHGGFISVSSQPGQGATFVIELPASNNLAPARATIADKASPDLREGRGRRVLVVDDEPSILDLVRDVLAGAGYEVVIERTGEEALLRLQQDRFALIICDLKMPGLSGRQVYEKVRAGDPEVARHFLFMTGDVMNAQHQDFFKQNGLSCLTKPFSIDEFRQVVGRAFAA